MRAGKRSFGAAGPLTAPSGIPSRSAAPTAFTSTAPSPATSPAHAPADAAHPGRPTHHPVCERLEGRRLLSGSAGGAVGVLPAAAAYTGTIKAPRAAGQPRVPNRTLVLDLEPAAADGRVTGTVTAAGLGHQPVAGQIDPADPRHLTLALPDGDGDGAADGTIDARLARDGRGLAGTLTTPVRRATTAGSVGGAFRLRVTSSADPAAVARLTGAAQAGSPTESGLPYAGGVVVRASPLPAAPSGTAATADATTVADGLITRAAELALAAAPGGTGAAGRVGGSLVVDALGGYAVTGVVGGAKQLTLLLAPTAETAAAGGTGGIAQVTVSRDRRALAGRIEQAVDGVLLVGRILLVPDAGLPATAAPAADAPAGSAGGRARGPASPGTAVVGASAATTSNSETSGGADAATTGNTATAGGPATNAGSVGTPPAGGSANPPTIGGGGAVGRSGVGVGIGGGIGGGGAIGTGSVGGVTTANGVVTGVGGGALAGGTPFGNVPAVNIPATGAGGTAGGAAAARPSESTSRRPSGIAATPIYFDTARRRPGQLDIVSGTMNIAPGRGNGPGVGGGTLGASNAPAPGGRRSSVFAVGGGISNTIGSLGSSIAPGRGGGPQVVSLGASNAPGVNGEGGSMPIGVNAANNVGTSSVVPLDPILARGGPNGIGAGTAGSAGASTAGVPGGGPAGTTERLPVPAAPSAGVAVNQTGANVAPRGAAVGGGVSTGGSVGGTVDISRGGGGTATRGPAGVGVGVGVIQPGVGAGKNLPRG